METSLMLAVRPDLVDMDQAEDVILSRSPYLSADLTSGGVVANAQPFSHLTDSGAIGAPTLADAERGRELLEALVVELAAFITEFSQWDMARNTEGARLD
jgi:creatinine amidohydrolase